MPSEKQKVYRLGNIPNCWDRHDVILRLSEALEGVSYEDIQIFSLAFSVDHLDESPPKKATLTFNKIPSIIKLEPKKSQWNIKVPNLSSSLILDSHFLGFTPLNDVSGPQHLCDCIAISGLSSHPFGSWQPHGSDKSFMWIRDSLPKDLPGVRNIIYGYDTALIDSTSFQTIRDLAWSLIQQLKANGWASPGSKKLVFLAHSLGGVILKETLVSMAESGEKENFVLSSTKGAIFFGVPSRGMHVSHFLGMVGSQPNQSLIKDLSHDSKYLANLDKRFDGISVIRQMKLFWAYETKTSPLYIKNEDGSVSKSSSEAVLVTPESATRGMVSLNPLATIQIDANHSDIVKFAENHHKYDIILSKLKEICGQRPDHIAPTHTDAFELEYLKPAASERENPMSATDPYAWDYEVLLSRLHAPERDRRLEQIEKTFSHTFDWIFDDRSAGLSKWLQDGQGVFWISGKPGSGKSTLMKLIVNDPRTGELLNRWTSKATMITAHFFFHHRGSPVQKSLSGLLRSILSQILEHKPELQQHLRPVLDARFIQLAKTNGLSLNPNLIGDLRKAWENWGLKLNPDVENRIRNIAMWQIPRRAFESMKPDFLEIFPNLNYELLQSELLSRFVRLSQMTSASESDLKRYLRDLRNDIPKLDDSRLDDFIIRWLNIVNLEKQIKSLLNDHGGGSHGKKGITYLVDQHKKRVTLRSQVQEDPWSISTLKEGLHHIFDQKRHELDICLFLDALDEYDGQPDVISRFIQDLAQQNDNSPSRIRICFSSRPWDAFVERFREVPGFKIQEHTEDDIVRYCIGNVKASHSSKALLDLVPAIATRAQGVFLWVKLVLQDLTRDVLNGATGEQLRATLDSFPDDLYTYYTGIVERIAPTSRWETYCALELVSRSKQGLDMRTLLEALKCSSSEDFSDGEKRLRKFREKTPEWDYSNFESQIRVISGGLLEIVASTNQLFVQFMHQTVEEFVKRPQLKQIILGHSRETHENGHSFLAKYYLLNRQLSQATYYAKAAEETTGRSLSTFILSISPELQLWPSRLFILNDSVKYSMLMFAVYSRLQLYLKDVAQSQPSIYSTSTEPLLSSLITSLVTDRETPPKHDALATMKAILQHGYSVQADRLLFEHIFHITMMIRSDDELRKINIELFYKLVSLLLEHNLDPNGESKDRKLGKKHASSGLLHVCTRPELAEILIRGGADINALDDEGFNPLDTIFRKDTHGVIRLPVLERYKMAVLLVKHGGSLHKTPRSEWKAFLAKCVGQGLDISVFRRLNVKDSKLQGLKTYLKRPLGRYISRERSPAS
ncbi:hypothetical protein V8C35DRAFT_290115 [Trichoderma chlorosporum]